LKLFRGRVGFLSRSKRYFTNFVAASTLPICPVRIFPAVVTNGAYWPKAVDASALAVSPRSSASFSV